MNLRTALARFRLIGLIEGISCIVLFFVAMPLKYLADIPMAVTVVGGIHGGLFVLYLIAGVNVWVVQKWGIGRVALAVLAAIPPFGTFIFDGSLKREQEGGTIQRYSSWAIVSAPLHFPWIFCFIMVLWAYKKASGPIAGEVWLAPLFLFVCTGLLGGLFGVLGLVSIQHSEGRLQGRWLAWTGVGLTVLFPVCGIFLGDLIRFVQGR